MSHFSHYVNTVIYRDPFWGYLETRRYEQAKTVLLKIVDLVIHLDDSLDKGEDINNHDFDFHIRSALKILRSNLQFFANEELEHWIQNIFLPELNGLLSGLKEEAEYKEKGRVLSYPAYLDHRLKTSMQPISFLYLLYPNLNINPELIKLLKIYATLVVDRMAVWKNFDEKDSYHALASIYLTYGYEYKESLKFLNKQIEDVYMLILQSTAADMLKIEGVVIRHFAKSVADWAAKTGRYTGFSQSTQVIESYFEFVSGLELIDL